jgi:aspartyl-tRNA(Asn)/glutamyl-tRNA(Gln) amidotransferase subunit B
MRDFDLPSYDAQVLTSSKSLATYFESAVKIFPQPKIISNWLMSELLRELKHDEREIEECPVSPEGLAELLQLKDSGAISGKIAKIVFEEMYRTGKGAGDIVEEKGLRQVKDEGAIESLIEQVVAENPKEVEQYRAGKEKLLSFFVGQAMKKTKGKANPQMVNEILKKILSSK